jgi:Tfp pilus assembly protein PilN
MTPTHDYYTKLLHARTVPMRETLRTWLPTPDADAACTLITTLEYIAECSVQLAAATTDRDRAAAWVALLGAVQRLKAEEAHA